METRSSDLLPKEEFLKEEKKEERREGKNERRKEASKQEKNGMAMFLSVVDFFYYKILTCWTIKEPKKSYKAHVYIIIRRAQARIQSFEMSVRICSPENF